MHITTVPLCGSSFCTSKIYVFSGQFEVVSPTVSNYRGGMRANYTVKKCGLFQRQSEIMLHTKTYYIAAMEVEWDYSLSRTWETELYRGQEKYRTRISLHPWHIFSAVSTCIAPTEAYFHLTFC